MRHIFQRAARFLICPVPCLLYAIIILIWLEIWCINGYVVCNVFVLCKIPKICIQLKSMFDNVKRDVLFFIHFFIRPIWITIGHAYWALGTYHIKCWIRTKSIAICCWSGDYKMWYNCITYWFQLSKQFC